MFLIEAEANWKIMKEGALLEKGCRHAAFVVLLQTSGTGNHAGYMGYPGAGFFFGGGGVLCSVGVSFFIHIFGCNDTLDSTCDTILHTGFRNFNLVLAS